MYEYLRWVSIAIKFLSVNKTVESAKFLQFERNNLIPAADNKQHRDPLLLKEHLQPSLKAIKVIKKSQVLKAPSSRHVKIKSNISLNSKTTAIDQRPTHKDLTIVD